MLNNASQDILSSLLPTLDDFDRAVKAVDSLELKDPFAEGVLLVYNKFKGILKNKGLTARGCHYYPCTYSGAERSCDRYT